MVLSVGAPRARDYETKRPAGMLLRSGGKMVSWVMETVRRMFCGRV